MMVAIIRVFFLIRALLVLLLLLSLLSLVVVVRMEARRVLSVSAPGNDRMRSAAAVKARRDSFLPVSRRSRLRSTAMVVVGMVVIVVAIFFAWGVCGGRWRRSLVSRATEKRAHLCLVVARTVAQHAPAVVAHVVVHGR